MYKNIYQYAIEQSSVMFSYRSPHKG